ncbi:MAG: hypothetical protein Q7K35_00160 [bacterium]|nr:hypothetical protein [bacterium]
MMGENVDQFFEQEKIKQEKVKILEKLNIGSVGQAIIMLVALDLKPATELDLYNNNDNEEVVKDALTKVGLKFANKDVKGRKNVVARLAIARDRETLDRLLEVSGKKDHEAYGRLMGYPETAVQAFIAKDLLTHEEQPPEMADNIFPMKLSKEHWREELENLRIWNEAIKKYAPDTYRQARGIN